MNVAQTERLVLRELTLEDAHFILELLNEDGFLRYIGDKGVRHLSDACSYIERGPIDSYRRHGFGLFAACLKTRTPIGICGLVKRETLADPDLGFAFLARYGSQGYALEAASAVLDFGRRQLKLPRIIAITSPDNTRSSALLQKLGLRFERLISLAEGEPQVRLFV
jgi:RimJ/RimL family protein N-acetyltransferase